MADGDAPADGREVGAGSRIGALAAIAGTVAAAAALFAVFPNSGAPPTLFERNCLLCHGPHGEGTFRGPSLVDRPRTYEEFLKQLREPRDLMPPFRSFTEDEYRDLHRAIEVLRTRGQSP